MVKRLCAVFAAWMAVISPASGSLRTADPLPSPASQARAEASPQQVLLNRYCTTCHNERLKTGGLALDSLNIHNVSPGAEVWERVVRKLRAGMMPPPGRPRPDEAASDQFVGWLETELDRAAVAQPNPGGSETFHRLNRAEYQNAIRDLLALEIDVASFLPADDSSYGFDNIAGVLKISQSLMERYLSTARTISRMAVGAPPAAADSDTYRVAQDLQQHDRVEGLPFGTRGGMRIRHFFPQDGEYVIRVDVGGANGLRDTHQLELTLDGEQGRLFTLAPRRGRGAGGDNQYGGDSSRLEARVPVKAGPHEVGATFFKLPLALVEQVREPFQNPRISGNDGGPGGSMPTLTSVTIQGPHNAVGSGDTPSRRRVFICQPASPAEEPACAKTILSTLTRRAYRGVVTDADVQVLLDFYLDGRAQGESFEAGIELALRRLLVSPEFLFRIEANPAAPARSSVSRVPDLELASRLSFFVWSSIPDDELLEVATRGRLSDPAVLDRQVRRMLADPRAEALTSNFAGQWLQLRNMDNVRPGDPYSLAFDESLRYAMRRETELLFDSVLRGNRSVLELLTADYTFLNERLAQHYGITNVQGSHFRRVSLPADSPRRGILGHGSILTMTSHAIRTSPVIRGKWILQNILGTPPPDPPPNVPALVDQRTQAKTRTVRERMAQHRSNPSCAACHALIDPAGFALENFDAIGRYRTVDESFNPIDASGVLPDGSKFDGANEFRAALVRRPERFVTTAVERLLTYALGRGLEHYDMPAVRKIVKEAAAGGYRFQSIILGVTKSYPFLMRRVDPAGRQEAAARP
jgi:mono/diheme cytochrome c family protein